MTSTALTVRTDRALNEHETEITTELLVDFASGAPDLAQILLLIERCGSAAGSCFSFEELRDLHHSLGEAIAGLDGTLSALRGEEASPRASLEPSVNRERAWRTMTITADVSALALAGGEVEFSVESRGKPLRSSDRGVLLLRLRDRPDATFDASLDELRLIEEGLGQVIRDASELGEAP